MKDTPPSKNIINYGARHVLSVFTLLLFLILMTTSFFILRPFMQVTSNTMVSQMLKASIQTIPMQRTNNLGVSSLGSKNKISKNDLSDNSNYLAVDFVGDEQFISLPFLYFVKTALEERLGKKVRIIKFPSASADYLSGTDSFNDSSFENYSSDYYWFQINNHKNNLGFKKQLIGTRPELTLFILLSFLLVIAWYLSSTISKKLNAPLVLLKDVTQKLSQGDFSASLPRHDFIEINQAFEHINQLAYHFKHLLEQRTIFLSGISHDIRTPITRLKLLIAINEKLLSEQFINKSNKALNEMEALVNIYLDSSEYLLKSENERVNINQLLITLISEKQTDHSKSIHFEETFKTTILINSTALKRVLDNLLTNSLKYAKPEKYGMITVKLSQLENQLSIDISDCGKGINNYDLEEVFKPFFRSHETKKIKGSGLGLSITRQICLSQGWHIQLSNKPNNTGLTVNLLIPTGDHFS